MSVPSDNHSILSVALDPACVPLTNSFKVVPDLHAAMWYHLPLWNDGDTNWLDIYALWFPTLIWFTLIWKKKVLKC